MFSGDVERLLANDGIVVGQAMKRRLVEHVELVRQWNGFASLVSANDLGELWPKHVADSVSLAPFVRRLCGDTGMLLDIGSGGGFPAVPLKVLFPELSVALIERSEKKVGFLRKAVAALKLSRVEIVAGEFPQCARGLEPMVITARAVDKPKRILKQILDFMPDGCTFLCQSSQPDVSVRKGFHVERIHDAWSGIGLRRGELWPIRRQ